MDSLKIEEIEFDETLYQINLEENDFPDELEYGKDEGKENEGEDNGDN